MVGGYLLLERPRFAGGCMWRLEIKISFIVGAVGICRKGARYGDAGCVVVHVCCCLLSFVVGRLWV